MTALVTITPEMATEYLANNPRNRPIKPGHLAFLCNELRHGRWKVNGDRIRIDKNGCLLDGQHRLTAVCVTGISIQTEIVFNLDPDVFDTIDSGAKRSPGDTLTIAGEKDGRNLAAAVCVADDLLNGGCGAFGRSSKTSNAEILEMLERHSAIRASMPWRESLKRFAPPAVSVALHYLFSLRDKQKADEFFNCISTGIGLDGGHPALLLRDRLSVNERAKGKLSRRYIIALFIKAWNAFIAGRQLKTLYFREEGSCPEVFPKIS